MSDPLSLLVLETVEARLREICVANGFFSNPRILLGVESLSESDLPAIVVWEANEDAAKADGTNSAMEITLALQLDCLVSSGPACTRVLARLRADVKRALLVANGLVAADGTKLGCLIYRGMQRLERPPGSTVSGFALTVAAKFKERYGDPASAR